MSNKCVLATTFLDIYNYLIARTNMGQITIFLSLQLFAELVFFVSGTTVILPKEAVSKQSSDCMLTIPINNLRHAPAILNEKTQTEVLPSKSERNDSHVVRIERDTEIRATCDRDNSLVNFDPHYYIRLTCVQGNEFKTRENYQILLREGLLCSNPRVPSAVVIKNGTCSEKGSNFDVVFPTELPPRKFYSSCMDEDRSEALFSSSYIDGESMANGSLESSGNRPDFRGQELYPFPIKQTYKWDKAAKHLEQLLGSEEMVKKYFPNQNYRFSRGHLFPNADGIKRYEKQATFYYMNTVPQWQILNAGNWANVEHDVRELAKSLRRRLNVTTGAFGVTTLKDANNNDVEVWLAQDKAGKQRLPVPKLVWKVVYDPVGSAAVAIVQINNPWVDEDELRQGDAILCNDLCSNLGWLKSKGLHTTRKGYTYCCDVQELRRTIRHVPDLEYTEVLRTANEEDSNSGADANYFYDDKDSTSGGEEDSEKSEEDEVDSSNSDEVIADLSGIKNATVLGNIIDLLANLSVSIRNNA